MEQTQLTAEQPAARFAAACPVLSVNGMSAGYPGARKIIHNITFDVLPGERIAVIGPNGAGKSTLFKALVGLIPHTTGHISIHGEDCQTSHKLIGYVPQQDEIDWSFPVSVYDVVMMGRERQIGWFRWPGRKDKVAVHTALEHVGLMRLKHRQIGELSGGQKRRVFIARALAQETDVLLLDEPFNGVDVTAEHEIMQTLDTLKERGITVILATHDLQVATTHFDRILMVKGEVIAYGTSQEVFIPSTLQMVYGGRVGIFEHNGQTLFVADEHGCA